MLSFVAGQDDAKDTLMNIIISPIKFPHMFKGSMRFILYDWVYNDKRFN